MSEFQIRLPATSANLGPGFDAVALALDLYLEVHADASTAYSIAASGRNIDICTRLHRNLMLAVYEDTLRAAGQPIQPLSLNLMNNIPIGMGCGSSAAARLAGIALANHFGNLSWNSRQILEEACRLEGHPDNASACWLGGFTVASSEANKVHTVSIAPPPEWQAILVLPDQPLATTVARSFLPATYTAADAIANVQNVALLTAAFHSAEPRLLQHAMMDKLHQPYRLSVCPLLPLLLPLAGHSGILGVALSGAGPAVLAIISALNAVESKALILQTVGVAHAVEIVQISLGPRFTRDL